MSDNRKYYYLKLKENYFDDDSIVLLESMQDGVLYSNKMCIRDSLCIDGGYTLAHDVRNTLDITARSFGEIGRAHV